MSADLELAERAARAAGEVLMTYYGRAPEGLDSKTSATDPVSDADREAERVIRELLSAERPDDGLVGEEGSHIEGEHSRRWIVDPLDGTVNFLYGLRAWGVSIALEDEQGLAVGVVFNPVSGECFAAERGRGATMSGRPIHVTERGSLDGAMVATGFSYESARRAEQAQLLVELLPRIRDIRRAGGASLDLAYVAAGPRRRVLRARRADLGRGRRPAGGPRGGRRHRRHGRRAVGRGGRGHTRAPGGAQAVRGLAAALQQVIDQRLDLLVREAALEGGH